MKEEKRYQEFIEDHQLNRQTGISVVSARDMYQLKSEGCTAEGLLDYLGNNYQSLFHGSRTDILDDHLKKKGREGVYSTDLAPIAILKAIYSNKNANLSYNYFINEKTPLDLRIHDIKEHTQKEKGFVYIINQTNGFENEPAGSWQYIMKGQDVPIAAKVAIDKSDFTHPVFDVKNNKRIQ